ncbi:hypothetical protein TNCV_2375931 [Trichonephila clavipes]|nr:hypothetical protein TNCV_2375931 [Trichonephila clavipes]
MMPWKIAGQRVGFRIKSGKMPTEEMTGIGLRHEEMIKISQKKPCNSRKDCQKTINEIANETNVSLSPFTIMLQTT